MNQTNMQLDGELEGQTGPKQVRRASDLALAFDALRKTDIVKEREGNELYPNRLSIPIYLEKAKECIKNIKVNPIVLQTFLDTYDHEEHAAYGQSLGLYMSVVLQECEESKITLDFSNLDKLHMYNVGFGLKNKQLCIIGNAGTYVGPQAVSSLFVMENAKSVGVLSALSTYIAKTFSNQEGSHSRKSYFLGTTFGIQTGLKSNESVFVGETINGEGSGGSSQQSVFICDKFASKSMAYYATNGIFIANELGFDDGTSPTCTYIKNYNGDNAAERNKFDLQAVLDHPHFQALSSENFVEYFCKHGQEVRSWMDTLKEEARTARKEE